MKKITTIFLTVFITVTALSQNNIEKLMTRRYLSCDNINYNVSYLIPEYYEKGEIDTLNSIIKYWEDHCGNSEELTRCKILFAIERNDFEEKIYNSDILDLLFLYKNNAFRKKSESLYMQNDRFNLINIPDTLNKFTEKLAIHLLERNSLTALEEFFLRIYSNDFMNTFSMITSDKFNGTLLQKLYYKEVEKYENQIIFHGDYLLGTWIPFDKLSIVGSHPFLGVRGGIRYKKLIVDATMGFKFGKSPNTYQVYLKDSLWNTDHFLGGYLGLDLAYELLKYRKNSFDLIGGVAYDGFDALDIPEKNISKTINALNLNIGLGYKHQISEWYYWGVDLKYNFINYKNPGGSNLLGNSLSINLIFGFLADRYENRLNQSEYYK